jgi:hypothetical protein
MATFQPSALRSTLAERCRCGARDLASIESRKALHFSGNRIAYFAALLPMHPFGPCIEHKTPPCDIVHSFLESTIHEPGRTVRLQIGSMINLASSAFRSRFHMIAYWDRSGCLRTGFGRRMGYLARASGSRPHRTVRLSSIFSNHPRDMETARRCGVGHTAVSATQGVGLRRCVLRPDGCCCIAMCLKLS